ncbi:MAG: sigma-54 dependent transcriptional regulator [Desulfobulbaceae bacterium]
MARIIIVDDDELLCETLADLLERKNHSVVSVGSMEEALRMCREEQFDVVFLDVRLPDGDGLSIIPELKKSPSEPEVIIMTGHGDPDGAEIAIKSGAWCYLEKSTIARELLLPLARALQYREEKSRIALPKILQREEIIGSSPQLSRSLELLSKASCSDVNVLITGETGTGKEIFASTIHRNSPRSGGEFVVVDCAALTETLVESILFGYVRGAFTGAEKERAGLVHQAHGGTLFLDEVGELPLGIQKSFLRVLQERKFRPVGSSSMEKSDFRLIAATNRDLEKLVESGNFREDLLFRLRSLVIELPPLRERGDDVFELSRYFVKMLSLKYGHAEKTFSPEFMEALREYWWPGNVRELFHALERAFATAVDSPTLHIKHLPEEIRVYLAKSSLGRKKEAPSRRQEPRSTSSLPTWKEHKHNSERDYLRKLIAKADYDIKKACKISGLSRARLYQLISKHGISSSPP